MDVRMNWKNTRMVIYKLTYSVFLLLEKQFWGTGNWRCSLDVSQHHHNCWSGLRANDTLYQCSSYSFQPPIPTTERNLLRDEGNNQVSTCHWHEPRICCASIHRFTITRLLLIYFLESCSVSMIVSWLLLIQHCWIGGSTSVSLEAGGSKHGAFDTKVGATYYG
jgi:hypothetical protein